MQTLIEQGTGEGQKIFHFAAGALPVLCGESVDGEPRDAQIQCAFYGVEEGCLGGFVTSCAWQALLFCPASVAVHYAGDMCGHDCSPLGFVFHGEKSFLAAVRFYSTEHLASSISSESIQFSGKVWQLASSKA